MERTAHLGKFCLSRIRSCHAMDSRRNGQFQIYCLASCPLQLSNGLLQPASQACRAPVLPSALVEVARLETHAHC